MRRGARLLAFTLLSGSVSACSRPAPPPYGQEEQRKEAHVGTQALAAALRDDAVAPACGTSLPDTLPRFALLVNARQALSCRDLGYLLRRVHPAAGSDGTVPWLLVPVADTSAVCPYLRQEKVRLPVVAVTAHGDALRGIRTVMMGRFTDGTPDTTYFAPTGREVLLKYQQDRSNAAIASPTTSRQGAS